MADVIFVSYIVFVGFYAYLCYGKYDFIYWMNRLRKMMQNG